MVRGNKKKVPRCSVKSACSSSSWCPKVTVEYINLVRDNGTLHVHCGSMLLFFLYLSNDLGLQRALQKEGFQRVDYKRSSLPSILCMCRFNCETVHYTWLCTNAVPYFCVIVLLTY